MDASHSIRIKRAADEKTTVLLFIRAEKIVTRDTVENFPSIIFQMKWSIINIDAQQTKTYNQKENDLVKAFSRA